MDSTPAGTRNRLLASLAPGELRRLEPHLEAVELSYRLPLYRANQPIHHVYFFDTGVGSLVHTMRKGAASEVGTIGKEGFVGLPLLFGDDRAPNNVYVQLPGTGWKMKSSDFSTAIEQSKSLRQALLHYAHAFFNQVAQSAVWAHHHSLDQRCCRWLLMTYDRMDSIHFRLTHEFLAMMLGVRRALPSRRVPYNELD